jgi:hypothetical protein
VVIFCTSDKVFPRGHQVDFFLNSLVKMCHMPRPHPVTVTKTGHPWLGLCTPYWGWGLFSLMGR